MNIRHLKHFIAIVIVILFTSQTYSDGLPESDNHALAEAFAFGSEIANNRDFRHFGNTIRIFTVSSPGECWGSLESCPNWKLFFTVFAGDLDGQPLLFELPEAKGWEFVSWIKSSNPMRAVFRVKTQIPGANIETSNRNTWSPVTYEVSIWLYEVVTPTEQKVYVDIVSDNK